MHGALLIMQYLLRKDCQCSMVKESLSIPNLVPGRACSDSTALLNHTIKAVELSTIPSTSLLRYLCE